MWYLIVIVLMSPTADAGGTSSTVSSIAFSSQLTCDTAAKALVRSGTVGGGHYFVNATCVKR
jgi:hypothetical protein